MTKQQRRAVNDEQKAVRRLNILEAAWHLFHNKSFDEISILDIAKDAGLAKGTLYLYFKSKEEVFLALLEDRFNAWFDVIDNSLRHRPHDAESITRLFAQTLHERRHLVALFAISHAILEQKVSYDAALQYKQALGQRVQITGELLEQHLAHLRPGDGIRVLLEAYAALIGVESLATPAPVVQEIFQREKALAFFRVDFETSFARVFYRIIAP